MHWYVVRVLSGREETVRDSLQRRIKGEKLEHRIPQVLVPVERVTEVKGGKKRVTNRKIYPGYLLLEAKLGDKDSGEEEDQKVWYTLHETPGFGDFVGGRNHPSPMSDEEVRSILDRMEASAESPRLAVKIKRNDMVRIKEGPFEGFDGSVEEVLDNKGLLRISVTIFGRATPMKRAFAQRMEAFSHDKPERPTDEKLGEMLSAYQAAPPKKARALKSLKGVTRFSRYQATAAKMSLGAKENV